MAKLRPPRPRASTRDPLARALLGFALGIGALRFVRLGEWGLWIDEAFTLADALHGDGFANPLGYWLVELFLATREDRATEFELRLVPALAGWACIPALWWAFTRPFGRRAAAAAALFLACSSWHLYWSQSARFYTLAMLLSLLGSGLVLRSFSHRSWPLLLAGVGVSGSAALAHPSAVFVLPGLLLAPFVLRRAGRDPGPGVRRTALAVIALGGLLGTGWALSVLGEWFLVKPVGGSPAHLALTTGFYTTPLLGAAGLVGAAAGLYRRQPGALVAATVVVVAFGAALTVSIFVRVAAQYVFLLLPWIAALAALPLARGTEFVGPTHARDGDDGLGDPDDDDPEGVIAEGDGPDGDDPLAGDVAGRADRRDEQEQGPGRRALLARPVAAGAWVAVVALPALTTCALYLGPRAGERPRWRAAYEVVQHLRAPGDLVLGMAAPVGEYYLAPDRTDLRTLREVVYLDRFRAEVPVFWDRFARRTWFVVNREELLDWPADDRRRFERILAEDCRLVAEFPLFVESRDLSVAVFVRD